MIALDYRDRRPLYEQIIERFQDLMYQEVLKENEKLPSVRSLAMELSINPNTIQRAYTELERQGFIYTVKGRGNFVAYDEKLLSVRKEQLFAKLRELVKEAGEIGVEAGELAGWLLGGQEKLGSAGREGE